jgi:uncharacterized protein (TIGR02186 family)
MTRWARGFLSVLLAGLPAAARAAEPVQPRVTLTPARIEMGSFYSGARVRIEGLVGHGSQAIVVLRGADKHESFNKKGRVGPIWLNAGSVRISGAPSLFLCFSPEPVRSLLNAEVIRQRLLDEASIHAHLLVEPAQAPDRASKIRSDFMELKKKDGLYRSYPGGLKMGAPVEEGTPFSAEFLWPKIAPPSSYTVRVLECRGGAVIAESSVPFEVVKVGFPRSFAVLATEHTAYYGVLAVLTAALAGFAIDFLSARLFGRKRGPAH